MKRIGRQDTRSRSEIVAPGHLGERVAEAPEQQLEKAVGQAPERRAAPDAGLDGGHLERVALVVEASRSRGGPGRGARRARHPARLPPPRGSCDPARARSRGRRRRPRPRSGWRGPREVVQAAQRLGAEDRSRPDLLERLALGRVPRPASPPGRRGRPERPRVPTRDRRRSWERRISSTPGPSAAAAHRPEHHGDGGPCAERRRPARARGPRRGRARARSRGPLRMCWRSVTLV